MTYNEPNKGILVVGIDIGILFQGKPFYKDFPFLTGFKCLKAGKFMEYEVKMNFYRDWIFYLKGEGELERAGYSPAENPDDISIQYFNLVRRLIPAVPRNVLIAKKFKCPSEVRLGFNLVKDKVKKGVDLRPHLSTRILDLDYDDDLLNDWGIHHLHLGTSKMKHNPSFFNRTGPVLLVRFDEQNAYFISIMEHGNWTNQDMIRIIHHNWAESIKQFKVNDAIGLNKPVTDRDIKSFRKSHVFSFIEPEPGVIYAPPGMGLTSSGVGLEVVRSSDHYANLMKTYEDVIRENIDEITENIKDDTGKLFFTMRINKKNVYAFEKNIILSSI